MLYEAGASQTDAQAYLERWGLMTPQLAAHVIRFLSEPTSRTYVITYPAGQELCRSFVAGHPERFRRLLTECNQVNSDGCPRQGCGASEACATPLPRKHSL